MIALKGWPVYGDQQERMGCGLSSFFKQGREGSAAREPDRRIPNVHPERS